jgi:zinc finger protein
MLLTSIPYFREVIIMSFRCDHCGNSNTEIQSAGEIQREPFTPVLQAMSSSWS